MPRARHLPMGCAMSTVTMQFSRTAERAFGDRTYTGMSAIRCSAPPRAPRHQWVGPARVTPAIDNQAEAIRLRDEERLRRDLWANCERRPIAMDRTQ